MAATWHPVKRTALHRRHLALGATQSDHHGWQVASHFAAPEEEARRVREGAGLADVSWLGKLEAKGLDPALKAPASNSRTVWPLARGHWLVTYSPEAREAVMREMEALASLYPCVRLTDVTSIHAAFLLAGPKSREVLRKLTSLRVDEEAMPEGSCAQAGVSHAHAIVLRQDVGSLPAFRLLVTREYGDFVWEAVMHAGRESGIAPFGLKALEFLTGGGGWS